MFAAAWLVTLVPWLLLPPVPDDETHTQALSHPRLQVLGRQHCLAVLLLLLSCSLQHPLHQQQVPAS
jgi:hypothetical protein